jgi:preprotein translocase subunit SecA
MFEELMHSIWEEFSRFIFHVEVEISPADVEGVFRPATGAEQVSYSGGTLEAQPSALAEIAAAGGGAAAGMGVADAAAQPRGGGADGGGADGEVVETVVKSDRDKIGRNDPCWCGSGKKYKKCHGA